MSGDALAVPRQAGGQIDEAVQAVGRLRRGLVGPAAGQVDGIAPVSEPLQLGDEVIPAPGSVPGAVDRDKIGHRYLSARRPRRLRA